MMRWFSKENANIFGENRKEKKGGICFSEWSICIVKLNINKKNT